MALLGVFFISGLALLFMLIPLTRYIAKTQCLSMIQMRALQVLVWTACAALVINLVLVLINPSASHWSHWVLPYFLVSSGFAMLVFSLTLVLAATLAWWRGELFSLLRGHGSWLSNKARLGLLAFLNVVAATLTAFGNIISKVPASSEHEPAAKAGISDQFGRRPATISGLNEIEQDILGLDGSSEKTYAYLGFREASETQSHLNEYHNQ